MRDKKVTKTEEKAQGNDILKEIKSRNGTGKDTYVEKKIDYEVTYIKDIRKCQSHKGKTKL